MTPCHGEAACSIEMSVMMACRMQNNFSNAACAREEQSIFRCTAQAEAKRKADLEQKRKGEGCHLLPKKASKLLKRCCDG
uniref:Uncharacterized protein n=1 Tax=Erpetoichthys calabaricus TaxID=27687 RepID=A0A8C4SBL7_ERPCA